MLADNSGTAGITFGLCYTETEYLSAYSSYYLDSLNREGTAYGYESLYGASNLDYNLNTELYSSLPNELQGVIAPVYKETASTSMVGDYDLSDSAKLVLEMGDVYLEINSDVDVSVDKVFVFSNAELLGETEYTMAGEGSQYQYFKDIPEYNVIYTILHPTSLYRSPTSCITRSIKEGGRYDRDTTYLVNRNCIWTSSTPVVHGVSVSSKSITTNNQGSMYGFCVGGTPYPEMTVTFDSSECSSVESQSVKYGEKIVKPDDPSPNKSSDVLEGWYSDPKFINKWDFDTDVVGASNNSDGYNIVLYPHWVNRSEMLSWSEIKTLTDSGYVDGYFDLGDTKTVDCSIGKLVFKIVGINHDDLADGSGKAALTFALVGTTSVSDFNSKYLAEAMGVQGTSWAYSNSREFLNNELYAMLPDDLSESISLVKKPYLEYHNVLE